MAIGLLTNHAAFFKDSRRNITNTWKGIKRLIGNEPKFNKITQLDTVDTKRRIIIAVNFQFKQLKRRRLKNQGFNGIRTRDLCDTGVMLKLENLLR